jgi:glycosyltransferase involved in cell wall biosynthesis
VHPELPSFDLVVATLGRVAELERLLDSLKAQTHKAFRVIVVDQNSDDRLAPVLAGHDLDILHLTAAPGLSRSRNAALDQLTADVATFPDDDCAYAPDLLEAVARRFGRDPKLDGMSVPTADRDGRSDPGWPHAAVGVTKTNVWNLVASAGIFLRRSVVDRVGRFDERLGLGVPESWSSGEETDYVIRALEAEARIEYDPTIVVEHDLRTHDSRGLRAQGLREGASVGYLLRKHDYPPRTLGRMVVRPAGGVVLSLAKRDPGKAGFHAATLEGRVRGYLGARRSKSSA